MPLDQLYIVLLTQLSEQLTNIAAQRPVDRTPPVLRHEYHMVSEVPFDVRLALPLSHGDLLPFEIGASSEGGHLLQLVARRNDRAFASLTAEGGGFQSNYPPILAVFTTLYKIAGRASMLCRAVHRMKIRISQEAG
jgi:hypothetical protein